MAGHVEGQATRLTIPNAPGALPFAGHAFRLLRNPLAFLSSLSTYHDLVEIRIGPVRANVVCDPDLTRQVLRDGQTFDKGGPIFERVAEVLGENSIGTCPHSRHRRLRTLVQPAFRRERFRGYARVMTANYSQLDWRAGQVIDVSEEMNMRALRTLVETMFSGNLTPQTSRDILDNTATVIREIYRRAMLPSAADRLPTPGNLGYRRARAGLRQVISDLLADRRASGVDHEDLLSALLAARLEASDGAEATSALTEDEIGDQLITFVTGGSETAASTLAWAFYLLGEHPDTTTELHRELDAALGGAPATFDDLPKLRFTGQVITEALRMYPPAWVFSRTVTADADLAGYSLPVGSTVVFTPYVIHHRADLYRDPERFEPHRWDADRGLSRNYFFPFGAGARKCVGDQFAMVEATLALANIAARWNLEPVPGKKLKVGTGISLRPRALMMRVSPR